MYEICVYPIAESAVFRRVKDEFGGFSNFSSSWPLNLFGTRIRTVEHIYQAMRFCNWPELQSIILAANKPKAAKLIAREYDEFSRLDWMDVRVEVMWWCLQIKLAQHVTRLGELILSTGNKHIVEYSQRDTFWGAAPDGDGNLVGRNVLGRLLEDVRKSWHQSNEDACVKKLAQVPAPPIEGFKFLGMPIGELNFGAPDGKRLIYPDQINEMCLETNLSSTQIAEWIWQRQLAGEIRSHADAMDSVHQLMSLQSSQNAF